MSESRRERIRLYGDVRFGDIATVLADDLDPNLKAGAEGRVEPIPNICATRPGNFSPSVWLGANATHYTRVSFGTWWRVLPAHGLKFERIIETPERAVETLKRVDNKRSPIRPDSIAEGGRYRLKPGAACGEVALSGIFIVKRDLITNRLVEPRYDGKLTVWGVVEGDGPWRMLLEDLEPLEETPPKPLLAAAKAERPSAIGNGWYVTGYGGGGGGVGGTSSAPGANGRVLVAERPERVEYERPMVERAFIRDTIVRRLFETDPRIIALIERVAEVETRRVAAMKRAWERARAPTKRCVEIDVFEECQNRVAAMFPPDSP